MPIQAGAPVALLPSLAALLAGAGDTGHRRILLLPTTSDTFAALSGARRAVVVVSDHAGIPQAPHLQVIRPLDAVRAPPGGVADIACFPDQYVSSVLAPLIGPRTSEHVSAVEVVLAHATSARVHGWWPDASTAADDTDGIVALVEDYFAHCARLGERWLLRDAQALRDPRTRADHLRQRVNHLLSSILHETLSCGRSEVAERLWHRATLLAGRVAA